MILAVTATEIEMQPFIHSPEKLDSPCQILVAGVGPMETAVRLTRVLAETRPRISCVVNFGIGGAYIQGNPGSAPELLDICLADREVAGDLGICRIDKIEYLSEDLTGGIVYPVDSAALQKCQCLLSREGICYHTGTFVTVNSVSATRSRGDMLRSRWNGLCENMEGAAVARACAEYSIPWLELRCISNYVEDRDPSAWRLQEGCQKAAETALQVIKGLAIR